MNDPRELVVVGAGGHATSVVDALLAAGRKPAFILDDDQTKRGHQVGGVVVRGPLSEFSSDEVGRFSIAVAIARNGVRRRLVVHLLARGATLCGVRHPSAVVSRQARIDPTAQIMAGAIVNAGVVVKAHAVLNTGCIVEHDVTVAEYAHIGPGAVLAGAVALEEGAFVASGATVCPFVRLGSWSTLGAGAVALSDLRPRTLAVGIPARPIREEQPDD